MKNIQLGSLTLRAAAVQAALLFSAGTSLMFTVGCSSEPDSHVVSAPPPSTPPPTTAPVALSGSGSPSVGTAAAVIVTQAPPVERTETVLERPSPKHVWIPGYWSYRESSYVWIAGRWELPPQSDSVWVAPRWERESNGYRYFEGYWK